MWYNKDSLAGDMIFLNNHVIGISWLTPVGVSHKILPTLYILRGKQAGKVITIERWDETENSHSWFNKKRKRYTSF